MWLCVSYQLRVIVISLVVTALLAVGYQLDSFETHSVDWLFRCNLLQYLLHDFLVQTDYCTLLIDWLIII